MVWVRLDDQFPDHPKIVAAGPCAAWLYVCGIAYSNRHLTDGFIPEGVAHRLADYRHVEMATGGNDIVQVGGEVTCEWMAEILCVEGLWVSVEGGYEIHDFLDFQPSKADVLGLKAVRKEAGRRGGKASSRAKDKQVLKQTASKQASKTQAEGNPVPVPVPEPEPSEGSNVIAKERRTPSYEASYEAEIEAAEREREANRYVERDDDGNPIKINELQTLGEAYA